MRNLIKNSDDGYTNYSINVVKSYLTDDVIQKYINKHNYKINGLAVSYDDTNLVFVVVDKLKTKKEFVGLIMHEIGHLLGLGHLPVGTVMYKYSNRPPKVTDCDRYSLIASWREWLKLAVH